MLSSEKQSVTRTSHGSKRSGSKSRAAAAEEEYEVEAIVGQKRSRTGILYWVKWKGYGTEDNTWQSLESLNCPLLLEQFQEELGLNPELDMTASEPETVGSVFAVPKPTRDAWEDMVLSIDGLREICEADGSKKIYARLAWNSGEKTEELLEDCIEAVPRSLLSFLLARLKFKTE